MSSTQGVETQIKIDTQQLTNNVVRVLTDSISLTSEIIILMDDIKKKATDEWHSDASGKFVSNCNAINGETKRLKSSLQKQKTNLNEAIAEYNQLNGSTVRIVEAVGAESIFI